MQHSADLCYSPSGVVKLPMETVTGSVHAKWVFFRNAISNNHSKTGHWEYVDDALSEFGKMAKCFCNFEPFSADGTYSEFTGLKLLTRYFLTKTSPVMFQKVPYFHQYYAQQSQSVSVGC
jgi:hypothetical protein